LFNPARELPFQILWQDTSIILKLLRASCKKVISAAMEKGADYADLFLNHTITNTSALEDGKVNSAYSNIDFGVGIRWLKGRSNGIRLFRNSDTGSHAESGQNRGKHCRTPPSRFDPASTREYLPPNYYPFKNFMGRFIHQG